MDACLDSFEREPSPEDDGPRDARDSSAPTSADAVPDAAAGAAPPDLEGTAQAVAEWGFVDQHGGIWQRAGAHGGERLVGRLGTQSVAAALELYTQRFRILEQRCAALEGRVRGAARPGSQLEAVHRETEHARGAHAIGDFDALLARLAGLEAEVLGAQAEQRARKEQLCAAAEQLQESTAWRSGADQVRALQQEWKGLGSAGREDDAQLWERFHAAASAFFERRAAGLAERSRAREEAKVRKLALCDRADALAESDEWREGGAFFAAVIGEWRAAGSAGRDEDQVLWRRLGAARRSFFRRRTAAFKQVQQERRANRERKEALCAAAESLLQAGPSNGAFRVLQGLQAEWTSIGPAGPGANADLWRRFRAACGAAYARVREDREQRRRQWLESLRDAHARKTRQAQGLRESVGRDEGHITRWRQALDRLRGGPGADEIRHRLEERIEDVENRLRTKSEHLAELQAALSDIQARLQDLERRGGPPGPGDEPPRAARTHTVD